jgi:DNA-binding response OmpR family regulator
MNPPKILIIEDNEAQVELLRSSLTKEFEILAADSGQAGLDQIRKKKPNLIIVDSSAPDVDQYDYCRRLRAEPGSENTPVILLMAQCEAPERIAALKAGADDCIGKPFESEEVYLRIKAILKRSYSYPTKEFTPVSSRIKERKSAREYLLYSGMAQQKGNQQVKVGDYMLDTRSFTLSTPSRGKVRLTPVQFNLLYHLMSHTGEVFNTVRLLESVWGYEPGSGSPDLVRVHIKHLRERIEEDPSSPTFLQTVSGYGYTIREPEE